LGAGREVGEKPGMTSLGGPHKLLFMQSVWLMKGSDVGPALREKKEEKITEIGWVVLWKPGAIKTLGITLEETGVKSGHSSGNLQGDRRLEIANK